MPTLWLLVGMVITMPQAEVAWFAGAALDNSLEACQYRGQTTSSNIIGQRADRGVFWTCFDITEFKSQLGSSYERKT
jgi:hypothetical protein